MQAPLHEAVQWCPQPGTGIPFLQSSHSLQSDISLTLPGTVDLGAASERGVLVANTNPASSNVDGAENRIMAIWPMPRARNTVVKAQHRAVCTQMHLPLHVASMSGSSRALIPRLSKGLLCLNRRTPDFSFGVASARGIFWVGWRSAAIKPRLATIRFAHLATVVTANAVALSGTAACISFGRFRRLTVEGCLRARCYRDRDGK
jgi:hypothetical protein